MPRIYEQTENTTPNTLQRIGIGRAGSISETISLANFLIWLGLNFSKPLNTWNSMTLLDGWVGTCKYRINTDNELHIYGELLSPASPSSNNIFLFPVGFRPITDRTDIVYYDPSSSKAAEFRVNTAGSFAADPSKTDGTAFFAVDIRVALDF